MIVRSYSPLFFSVLSVAFAPNACGGDSNEADGKGGGAGEEAGASGKGGTTGNGGATGKGGTAGKGGTTGNGGTAGKGGSTGKGGTAGDGGTGAESGDGAGGVGGAGEGGLAGDAGGGSGGQPGCPFDTTDTVSGTLRVTTDDNYRLYVNGVLIDDVARLWSAPQTYTVNVLRHPAQKNVIAVEGTNTAKIDGLDRGVIVDLAFDAGGGTQSVLSDATWKLSTTLVSNWFAPSFVDTAWVAATDEGLHGIAPYGNVLGTSLAHWIWSYLATGTAAAKPDMETIWVRKSFYVNAAGSVTATPTACP